MAISIIGMACRFPGSRNLREFWLRLQEGGTHVAPLSDLRYPRADFAGLDPARAKFLESLRLGQIDEPFSFDPAFFGINDAEALQLDPQQRLLLQAAWEALEDAGIPDTELKRGMTGVYVGAASSDYAWRPAFRPDRIDAYTITGNTLAILANRISFQFGLKGPSLTVDTACSAALSAVALAMNDLRAGNVDLAIVGAASLLTSPLLGLGFAEMGVLSRAGLCRFGSREADGYVRGEGLGVVILRRSDDPAGRADRVYAELADCRIAASGRGRALVVPQLKAQRDLLTEIYGRNAIDPRTVDYVEAHGTGTPVGDLVELSAFARVFGANREKPLYLGSVKNSCGHLEPASGMAGLIKTALMIRHQKLVPTPHCEPLRDDFDFRGARFEIARRTETREIAVAGVSAYGFGGTLAHAILRRPARPAAKRDPRRPAATPVPLPVIVSANAPRALRESVERWRDAIDVDASLADLAYTACRRRSVLRYRAVFFADSAASLRKRLDEWIRRNGAPRPFAPGKSAFVFAGTGARWIRAARVLSSVDSFRRRFESLARVGGVTIDGDRDEASLGIVEHHVAYCAYQIAFYRFLEELGLRVDVVLGHSIGEVAAAVAAGYYEDSAGIRIARTRAEALARAQGRGRPYWAPISGTEAESLAIPGVIEIAATNGPESTVLTVLDPRQAPIDPRFREVRAHAVPAHSSALEPFLPPGEAFPAGATPSPGSRPVFWSTALARPFAEPVAAAHWREQLRRPVRFAETVAALASEGIAHWVEPTGTHVSDLESILRATDRAVPMRGIHAFADGAAPSLADFCARWGAAVSEGLGWEMDAIAPREGEPLDLPLYPWQTRHFELPAVRYSADASGAPASGPRRDAEARDAEPGGTGSGGTEADARDLETELRGFLRGVHGDVPIESEVPLREYGMDSIVAIGLRQRLSARVPRPPSLAFLMRGPSIREILRRIERGDADDEGVVHRLREPRDEGSIHCVCFPFGGGILPAFADWPDRLPEDWGLTVVLRPADAPTADRREAYLAGLESAIPTLKGRLVFLGYSLGANVALALLARLKRSGRPPPEATIVAGARRVDSAEHLENLAALPDERLDLWLADVGQTNDSASPELLRHFREDLAWGSALEPGEMAVLRQAHLVVARGRDDRYFRAEDLARWGEALPNARLVTEAGGHFFLSEDPGRLAALLGIAGQRPRE